MCNMISCLVGKDVRVYAKDGLHSHSEISRAFGISEDQCLKYEFILRVRELFQDFNMDHAPFDAKASHDRAAQRFFDECASTPEKFIAFVERGNFNKNVLIELLTEPARGAYYRAEESASEAYNRATTFALKVYDKVMSSVAADEAYNEARASALEALNRAMVSAWIELFKNPKNRIEIWRN